MDRETKKAEAMVEWRAERDRKQVQSEMRMAERNREDARLQERVRAAIAEHPEAKLLFTTGYSWGIEVGQFIAHLCTQTDRVVGSFAIKPETQEEGEALGELRGYRMTPAEMKLAQAFRYRLVCIEGDNAKVISGIIKQMERENRDLARSRS